MLERGKMERDVIEIVGIDSLVPQDHLLRKIDRAVDFNRLYEMVEPLYCEDNGRPSIDPVVLFKMVLIQHLYGLPSLRRTAEEVSPQYLLSLVSGVQPAGGDPTFLHGELQFPAPLYRGNGRPGIPLDSGGSGAGGISLPQGSFYRRHAYQSQRQHKKAGEGSGSCGIQALRQGIDGGGKRRPGGPWKGTI